MPCLVLTGHPCVGKTTFAKKVEERALLQHPSLVERVVIVNEETVCVNDSKSGCYANSAAEKSTRASIKTRVDQALHNQKKTLVLVDSLNYIKGYRYELHCLSKAAGQKHGVVWLLNSSRVAQEWNQQREDAFTKEQMEELIQRYEPPDARNRWDKPLWRIDLTPPTTTTARAATTNNNTTTTTTTTAAASSSSSLDSSTNQAAQEALAKSVYNMHSLSDAITTDAAATVQKSSFKKKGGGFRRAGPKKKTTPAPSPAVTEKNPSTEMSLPATITPPQPVVDNNNAVSSSVSKSVEQQIDDMLDSFLLDVAPLQEGMSTRQHRNADSNVLHQLDGITFKICHAIVVASSSSNHGNKITLAEYDHVSIRNCPRPLSWAELKRWRREYLRWVARTPPEDTSPQGVAVSFCNYIESQLLQ